MTAGQTLVAGDVCEFKNREREVRQHTYTDLIGSYYKPVAALPEWFNPNSIRMRERFIPHVLGLVDVHCPNFNFWATIWLTWSTPALPFGWQELVEIFRTPRSL